MGYSPVDNSEARTLRRSSSSSLGTVQEGDESDGFKITDAEEDFKKTSAIAAPPEQSRGEEGVHHRHDPWKDVAAVAGNVLEWYDFSAFGYFADIIAKVFFPPQAGNLALVESFLVFAGAFLMRPIGGAIIGYIGDKYGRKLAVELSIFLMAVPTFVTGLLPSYAVAGEWTLILLVITRMLQGLSVGGQLTSSLVFTMEDKPREQWGWYGACVIATASLGGLLGGLVSALLRAVLSEDQLVAFGWRIPFLSGIIVSLAGVYLRYYCEEDEESQRRPSIRPRVPFWSRKNLQALLSTVMATLLFAGGGYLINLWMATFMDELVQPPVPQAFAVNCLSTFVGSILGYPFFGYVSDRLGRLSVMTIGAVALAVLAPFGLKLISTGNPYIALGAQTTLSLCHSMWGSSMFAWMVQSFPSEIRLTSVGIGYNVAQALVGGFSPAIATVLVSRFGPTTPGYYITALSIVSLLGVWVVAPSSDHAVSWTADGATKEPKEDPLASSSSSVPSSIRGQYNELELV